jgi:acyl-CoA synthetase (AMP-forming)/AMP-acid ligase II/thioesterase domain-containing protein/acyl carrier protein
MTGSAPMQTLGQVIRSYAFSQPSRPAIVSIGKKPLSYDQLHRQIRDIGAQLQQAGLGSQARIGVTFLNGPEAVVIIVAIACHATVVPINNSLSLGELRQLFEQTRLDALVLGPDTSPSARKTASDFRIAIVEARSGEGAEIECTLSIPAGAAVSATEPGSDSVAVILQTSGTTGRPKLVPITHKNLQYEAAKIRNWFELAPDDRCLSFVPLHYAHGLRETIFPPLITGGSVARPENHAHLDIVEWLGRLKPTWYSAFPVFHASIFEQISCVPGAEDLHCLRFVLSSGTPLKPELQQGLALALGAPVLEFYGIGEAGHMSANLPRPGRCKPGTCGSPLPGEMVIAREGQVLPPGQLGEVLVRGPTVMAGYLDNPQANQAAFVDGWFRTGDLGLLDVDGFLSIYGRYKELINRGGEKLAPIEIEEVLLRHPAVAEAAAFGVAHPRLGEDVAAAVVLDSAATATAAELRAFVGRQLAHFKIPRQIAFLRELPKDVTGKVRRRELATTLTSEAAATSAQALDDTFEHCPLTADLVELWRNLLQCDSVGLDDDFFVKGGDSLLAVRMRLALEQLTGLVIPETSLFESSTVRQLVQAVAKQSEPEAAPLVAVGPGSEGHRLFFFHGDLMSAGYYVRRLGTLLGRTTTLISVAPHGLGLEPIPLSIEEMAKERLPLILGTQPIGAFRLAGYCNGGTVAFEVARLLQAAGHRIELLAMIDVPMVNAGLMMRLLRGGLTGALRIALRDAERRQERMEVLMEHAWLLYESARQFWRQKPAQQRAKIAAKLKSYSRSLGTLGTLRARRHLHADKPPGSNHSLLQKERHYFRALAMYFPKPINIPIVYYSAEHSGRYLKGISSQLEIIRLRSDHFSCITTDVHMISDHLAQRLR